MKTFTALAIAALCGIVFPSPARADVPDIRGRWLGFGQSMSSPGASLRIDVSITGQTKNRTFTGSGTFELKDFSFDAGMTLTISDDGNVAAQGKSSIGEIHVNGHGKKKSLNGGLISVIALKYHINAPGFQDDGALLILQMQGGINWNAQPSPIPDLTGHWMGNYASSVGPGGGCIELSITQQRNPPANDQPGTLTSAFGGTLNMDQVYIPQPEPTFVDLNFDVLGTVGITQPEPNHSAPFALIGLKPVPEPSFNGDGIIAILIGLTPSPEPNQPPSITGGYALYGSFFDVFAEVWNGSPMSFDMGGFMVMPGG